LQIEGVQVDLSAEGRQIAWSASLALGVESLRGYLFWPVSAEDAMVFIPPVSGG
jgi:hypothetical protein